MALSIVCFTTWLQTCIHGLPTSSGPREELVGRSPQAAPVANTQGRQITNAGLTRSYPCAAPLSSVAGASHAPAVGPRGSGQAKTKHGCGLVSRRAPLAQLQASTPATTQSLDATLARPASRPEQVARNPPASACCVSIHHCTRRTLLVTAVADRTGRASLGGCKAYTIGLHVWECAADNP